MNVVIGLDCPIGQCGVGFCILPEDHQREYDEVMAQIAAETADDHLSIQPDYEYPAVSAEAF